jgi:hypothetical protein
VAYVDDDRRSGAIMLTAAPGHVRAARGIIGRAIRKALGVKRWYEDPWVVHYDSAAHLYEHTGERLEPRFNFWATDEEMKRVEEEIDRSLLREGWRGQPYEIYHD